MSSRSAKMKRPDSGESSEVWTRKKGTSTSQKVTCERATKTENAADQQADFHNLAVTYKRSPDEEESVFVTADKIFRLQVDWMVRHAGVCKEFPDIMRRLWWGYLTKALPDMSRGIEDRMFEDWKHKLRDVDFAHLLDVSVKSIGSILSGFEEQRKTQPRSATYKPFGDRNHTPGYGTASRSHATWGRLFIERLTPCRIPVLIVMGLRLCGEYTLISDVLRWIRCHQYPHLNPVAQQQDDDQSVHSFQSAMDRSYSHGTPVYAEIEWQVAALGKLLKIDVSHFPVTPVAPVVARFVEELNLPRAMVGFAMAVAENTNTVEIKMDLSRATCQGRAMSRGVEAFAMACVVYAMRIMFGMDGEAETAIGHLTVSLQELVSVDQKLFDFKEWICHMDFRRMQLFRHTYLLPQSSTGADIFLADAGSVQLRPFPTDGLPRSAELWRLDRRLADEVVVESKKLTVVLPPTHRPFRAHTEVLASTFPQLSVDFTDCRIEHLLLEKVIPDDWNIPS